MNVYGNKSIINIHYDNVLQGPWKYRTAAQCTETQRPGDSTGCVINISAVAGPVTSKLFQELLIIINQLIFDILSFVQIMLMLMLMFQ